MSQAAIPATTTNATFVVRLWREATAGEVRWRGRIEHVQSGETIAFLDLEGMLQFIRKFGIPINDKSGSTST